MPWLVVTGGGSWRPAPGVCFEAGVHEVDDGMAAQAIASGIRALVVTAERPLIVQDEPGAPLSREDILIGATGGVRIQEPTAADDAPEPGPPAPPLWEVPLDYHCPYCPWPSPTKGALDRHIEFHHQVAAQAAS